MLEEYLNFNSTYSVYICFNFYFAATLRAKQEPGNRNFCCWIDNVFFSEPFFYTLSFIVTSSYGCTFGVYFWGTLLGYTFGGLFRGHTFGIHLYTFFKAALSLSTRLYSPISQAFIVSNVKFFFSKYIVLYFLFHQHDLYV